MKKTYIAPSFIIVDLKPRQILAASPGYGGTTALGSGNLSREYDDDIEDEDSWW